MKVIITKNYDEMSEKGANLIVDTISAKPGCVLGLATGSTPIGMYQKLVNYYNQNKVDFSRVATFNLDEYKGLSGNHVQSYRYFMDNNLFNHININKTNTHVPDGTAENVEEECKKYDSIIFQSGGIDLQVLGIGNNGHIGFNEPSDTLTAGTHVTSLTIETIHANARFFQSIDEVPTEAITMGLGGIMKSRKILLLASGGSKANIIKELIDGKINTKIPASLLQVHPDVTIIVDEAAAADLKDIPNNMLIA